MLVDIENLPPSTRVWVYQADKDLDAGQQHIISKDLTDFCARWEAHGQGLASNFEIRNQRFVLLYVNEAARAASGCSIDGSVRVMKTLQQQLSIDFFDRTQVPFLLNEKIETISISTLKNAFADGSVSAHTTTFNTLATTKAEIDEQWLLATDKTWLAKYLPKTILS